MRYLFPVPAEPMIEMLNERAKQSDPFTTDLATLDVMLDLDRRGLKPVRYYAKRWKWSVGQVHKKLPELQAEQAEWRARFGGISTPETVNTRERTVNKKPSKQAGSEGSVNSRERTVNSTIQSYNPTIGEEKDTHVISGTVPAPSEVMKSWNDFASRNGLSPIRKVTAARAEAIRKRRAEIWPDIEAIYARIESSGFLLGGGTTGWRIDFDFLWGRPDAATKILEGKYDNGKNTQRRIEQDYPDQFAA